jgi:hypothetical protein
MTASSRRPNGRIEHDPEKWAPIFRKDHVQIKKIERFSAKASSDPIPHGIRLVPEIESIRASITPPRFNWSAEFWRFALGSSERISPPKFV